MDRPGWHSRGYLPHCDEAGRTQHVVFRLVDSLPKTVMAKMEALKSTARYQRCDEWLDRGSGAAILKSSNAANTVIDALLHFDGERYALVAWCVMPNHVHVVVEPRDPHLLRDIVKSWKAFTAAKINKLNGRIGRLWAPDYFDRFMRSEEHLLTTIAYVENNPVAAKLCATAFEWPFSSACLRAGMRV